MLMLRSRFFMSLLLLVVASFVVQMSRHMTAEESVGVAVSDTLGQEGNQDRPVTPYDPIDRKEQLARPSIPNPNDRIAQSLSEDAMLREILAIRETVNAGGGIEANPSSPPSTERDQEHAAFIEALQIASRDIARDQPTWDSYSPSSETSRPDSDQEFLLGLLAASRQIDEKVHQLDARSDFKNADRLRQLADQLRFEARRFSEQR